MKRIFKYEAEVGQTSLALPIGAEILCLKLQAGMPCVWALVDDSAAPELRAIAWLATGQIADSIVGMDYVGTVLMAGGGLVFHLFIGAA